MPFPAPQMAAGAISGVVWQGYSGNGIKRTYGLLKRPSVDFYSWLKSRANTS
jgi:hypothetical protein